MEIPLTYTMQLFLKAHKLTCFETAYEDPDTLQLGESDLVKGRTPGRLLAMAERGMKSLTTCVWGSTSHQMSIPAVHGP